MKEPVVIALVIEVVLFAITAVLLVQPRFILDLSSPRAKSFSSSLGIVFLFVLFVWSVIFGCALSIDAIRLR